MNTQLRILITSELKLLCDYKFVNGLHAPIKDHALAPHKTWTRLSCFNQHCGLFSHPKCHSLFAIECTLTISKKAITSTKIAPRKRVKLFTIHASDKSACNTSRLGPSRKLIGGVLPLCSEAVGVFYSPSRLGNRGL